MRTSVGKWGNSLGIRIPGALAEDVRLTEGTEVEIVAEEGRLVIAPVLSLTALVERITRENLPELAFDDAARGVELW